MKWGRFVATSYRQARRIVILLAGSSVMLVGVVMIFMPGPAFFVIPLGLAILAIEFAWARRWLRKLRQAADGIQDRLRPQSDAKQLQDAQPRSCDRA